MDSTINEIAMRLYQSIDHKLDESNLENKVRRIRPEILDLFVTQDPSDVDYVKIRSLDNEDFFFAVYICLCRRPPSEADVGAWSIRMQNWPKDRFQAAVIDHVARSGEVLTKGTKLNHYSLFKPLDRKNNNKRYGLERIPFYSVWHKIYMKLPMRIRIILKRILIFR